MSLPRALYRVVFLGLERLGIHVTPNLYGFPIPDLGRLRRAEWPEPAELPDIDFRDAEQLRLLETLSQSYREEYRELARRPGEDSRFHLRNRHFEGVDAEILYGLMRELRPKHFVEVGSGFSTLLALEAAAVNQRLGRPCAIKVFDPYAGRAIRARAGSGLELHAVEVQRAPLATFQSLGAGDILFIDSSHILQVGSDVRFLFGEVVPRLAPGVRIHVHDVFLPADYPRYWVTEHLRFWNEQYLVRAFLSFNPRFRVVWGSFHMVLRHPRELAEAFPSFRPDDMPASFWFERVS